MLVPVWAEMCWLLSCPRHLHPACDDQVFLTSQYLGIAMEFASGGDMFEYVVKKNGLREEEARWFFQQLIVGLDYCHRMVRHVTGSDACKACYSFKRRQWHN